ncbi:MAG TPA: BrnT family toxin [Blastocatellia bacterium]|nr:BrnT family toxin [Blastocatellia bacterium]
MKVYEIIWKEQFIEKIADNHGVNTDEVEEVLFSQPHVRFAKRGHVRGDNLYFAYGQTVTARYLLVVFIRKRRASALPTSARDMTKAERTYYNGQKKKG